MTASAKTNNTETKDSGFHPLDSIVRSMMRVVCADSERGHTMYIGGNSVVCADQGDTP